MKKIVAVVAVACVVAGIWFFTGRGFYADPQGDPNQVEAVILVPGYGGGAGSLVSLRENLAQAGYEVYILDIGEGTGDLGQYGASLATQVQTIASETGSPVHIVGFSAGGVIARASLETAAPSIARIVTLGSPHQGTSIASVGAAFGGDQCPLACQQLARGSDFLGSLPLPSDSTRWFSVYSPTDAVVVPVETAILDGSTSLSVTDLCGAPKQLAHSDIPQNPLVIAAVADFLESGSISSDKMCLG